MKEGVESINLKNFNLGERCHRYQFNFEYINYISDSIINISKIFIKQTL